MIGLEENFRKWLIKEGKGKTSSRQLILAINKVCQDFYNGNTEKHWRILTKHIVSILIPVISKIYMKMLRPSQTNI